MAQAKAAARWARAEAVSHAAPIRSRHERAFQPAGDASEFERLLQPLARRLIWQRTAQHAPRALLVGALFALTITLITRGRGLPGLAYVALPFALLISLATVAIVARRSAGPFEVARRTDAQLGLREKIATALELSDTGAKGPLVEHQITDALAVLSNVDPRDAFPTFAVGSAARARAMRNAGWGTLALAAALLLLLWPAAGRGLLMDREGALAMADPVRREEDLIPRFRPEEIDSAVEPGEGLRGLTERPEELGDLQGLLGEQAANPGQGQGETQAPGAAAREARREAAEQQSGDVAQRQQALAALGEALRQSQTAKQAGESLRSGDTARASQQLSQVAENVRDLSPGERQALAQAFQQAATNIGEQDRPLASAAQRAAEALRDFRNQDAQRAIGETAAQVRESGQQIQEQRALGDRQQQMENGGEPNLPSLQQPQPQGGAGQQDAGPRSQQAPSRTEAGGAGAGAGSFDLSALEAEMRDGGLQSGAGGTGSGGGTNAGSDALGAPTRLSVAGRTLTVDAEVRDGPSQWRPPNPNSPPAVMPPPAAPVPGAPASAAEVASGLDMNAVPLDLSDPVRQYFTPEQAPRP